MQLEIKKLKKVYGKKMALDDYTVILQEGIYGVLGENGAGKSTLMNLITDNIKRTSGEILYNGTDIIKLGKNFRKVLGFMPQQQGIYENMTAQTFLYYIAEIKGISKKNAQLETEHLLKATNLYEVRHKKLGEFSGGMKQRVLLAQALLGDPKVLILDEPTAGLDPKERIRIRNFISSLSRDRIILYATHIVSDIESISDKIIMMKKGHLIGMDTPSNLMSSLKNKVKIISCKDDEIEKMQKIYKIGNIFKRDNVTYIRVIGDDLPDEGEFIDGHISLDDVYLYYLAD